MTLRDDSEPDRAGNIMYRLDLEYDGTRFRGWQLQADERTVQGCIERAVAKLFEETVCVIAAGRTDTGVHASGQVAHFCTHRSRPPDVVLRALNATLPEDIRVKAAALAPAGFHARFSARWRSYRYRIARTPIAIGRAYCWNCPHTLKLEPMREAASFIVGDHSFRSFAHSSEEEPHYLSTVYRAEWQVNHPYLEFHIEANRFLHGMVRLLVGTFVDVGRGKIAASRVREILQARDVRLAGPKAPACGLTLVAVGYEPWSSDRRN